MSSGNSTRRPIPTPSKTTHHTLLEVAWTIIPVMILVVIAIPSFRLLTHQLVIPQPDVTIKVTGNQWYWSYAYPKDQGGGFGFDSLMKAEDQIDASKGDIRLLTVDNEAVVPVGKKIRIQVTASDVIHSFTVPAFGVRIDAVPGRLNEAWFQAEREGIYYGQCSKICGKDHAYMPIAFRVVSEAAYADWLAQAQKKFASLPPADSVRRRFEHQAAANIFAARDHGDCAKHDFQGIARMSASDAAPLTHDATRPIIRRDGGAICSRPTTRTSARSI